MRTVKQDHLEKVHKKHMAINSIEDLDPEEALQICGELLDASFYLNGESGIHKAIGFLKELEKKSLPDDQKFTVYYYLGNAHSDLDSIDQESSETWNNENKERAVYYYRRALGTSSDKSTKAKVLVNLANSYSSLGRFVKSIELYRRAIEEKSNSYPTYMATGNKGICLFHYANNLHDKGHKMYFAYFAYTCLKDAIKNSPDNTQEKRVFESYLKKLNTKSLEKINEEDLKLNSFSLGNSKKERKYREWCLKNRLFLNPINDLGEYNISARDVLHLPSMTFDIEENHFEFPSFFNQLKQEYVSARYLFYEGVTSIGTKHFSDSEVLLINPLDYPRYSFNVEKIKNSFRTLYSIFDKISLFLRKYLKLHFSKDYSINFMKVWYEDNAFKTTLNQDIVMLNNQAFKGLYLLSKDLLFHDPNRTTDEQTIKDLALSLEPSAKEMNLLRNSLEHGYVKIHDDFYNLKNDHMFTDKLSYPIKESDLTEYSIKLLSLVRESLIYLSLGVHIEEIKKKKNSKGKVGSIDSDIYDDNWKR